jgi:hypothetical protein
MDALATFSDERRRGFTKAAAKAGMHSKELAVFDERLRDIYGADLVVVIPDQVVAWRSGWGEPTEAVIGRVLGSRVQSGAQRAIA